MFYFRSCHANMPLLQDEKAVCWNSCPSAVELHRLFTPGLGPLALKHPWNIKSVSTFRAQMTAVTGLMRTILHSDFTTLPTATVASLLQNLSLAHLFRRGKVRPCRVRLYWLLSGYQQQPSECELMTRFINNSTWPWIISVVNGTWAQSISVYDRVDPMTTEISTSACYHVIM